MVSKKVSTMDLSKKGADPIAATCESFVESVRKDGVPEDFHHLWLYSSMLGSSDTYRTLGILTRGKYKDFNELRTFCGGYRGALEELRGMGSARAALVCGMCRAFHGGACPSDDGCSSESLRDLYNSGELSGRAYKSLSSKYESIAQIYEACLGDPQSFMDSHPRVGPTTMSDICSICRRCPHGEDRVDLAVKMEPYIRRVQDALCISHEEAVSLVLDGIRPASI